MNDLVPAGLLRRLPALALDMVPAAATVALLFAVDVFALDLFSPPPGWFWTEWMLKYWLDAPGTLLAPLVTLVGVALLWTAGWEATTASTPGGRVLRLRVVDLDGHPIGPTHAAGRLLGALLGLASLGLGYLWIVVSHYRRGWHDLVSGTVVIRDAD